MAFLLRRASILPDSVNITTLGPDDAHSRMHAAITRSTEGRYIGGDTRPPQVLTSVILSEAKDLRHLRVSGLFCYSA
jgi:hypothetical protein